MKNAIMTLALLAAVLVAGVADATREPNRQITASAYTACIGFYHVYIHPLTGRFIRCRFRPTCSNYSALAVQRFGIVRGLRLTLTRLLACQQSVQPGTFDPVPAH